MTTYPMHYTDNAHSWRRMLMLFNLYWPGLKPGFIICAVVPFVAVFLAACIASFTGAISDPLVSWPISLLIMLSPIMLTKRDYRSISAQLPATASEKLGFLLMLFWILIPSIVTLSAQIGQWLSVAVFGSHIAELLNGYKMRGMTMLGEMGFSTTVAMVMSCLSTGAIIVVVLYYVVTAKKNRVIAAFLSLFCAYLILLLVSGLVGGVFGVVAGFNSTDPGAIEADAADIVRQIVIWLSSIATGACAIAGIVYSVKLYKRLRNCGF